MQFLFTLKANFNVLNFCMFKCCSLTFKILLGSVPEEIGGLKKLETINLNTNDLTSLPSSFSNLVNLRTINLSNNKITVFPPVFSSMKHLELLDLSHNKLTEVPDFVSQVSAIEINLNQNQVIFFVCFLYIILILLQLIYL